MKRHCSIGHCPVCRTTLAATTSSYGESHCPRCDGQLWYLALPSGAAFCVRRADESIYDLMADLGASQDGFTAEHLEATLRDADPLDVAEVLQCLEDALYS
jgi:hypothetical protein